jgi:hypothetical protein
LNSRKITPGAPVLAVSAFEPNMQSMFRSAPVLFTMLGFLLVYAVSIVLVFRPNKWGRRRRWLPLDFIWVPLGGLTGLCLVVLWWRFHGPR